MIFKEENTTVFRNIHYEKIFFRNRIIFSIIFILFCVGILLFNCFYLQVINYDNYNTKSDDNRIKLEAVAPNRGLIYDKNSVLLVGNKPAYSLIVIPEKVTNLHESLVNLKKIITIRDEDLDDFYKELRRRRGFHKIVVRSNLSFDEVAQFSVKQHFFPGFFIISESIRQYYFSEALAHVIGYVGRINQQEQLFLDNKKVEGNYAATQVIGKIGLEKQYEFDLHGKIGFKEVEVDSRGRVIRELKDYPMVVGYDLYLTLDIELQKKAYELLEGRRGAIVALEPSTGEILAIVSSPSFDTNLFVNGISYHDYDLLLKNTDKPLLNRTVKGLYSPASTVKPFLGLLGLEEEKITTEEKMWDKGWWQIPNHDKKYRDWKASGHGWVDLKKAVMVSCDPFFYELSYRLGIDSISDFMKKFGFGKKTEVDLYGEKSGIMPSREWKENRYQEPWYIGDTISVGIGQGYWTSTPLQLGLAMMTLVNEGKTYMPHLVVGKKRNNDENIERFHYEAVEKVKLKDDNHWKIIKETMYATAHEPTGSGYKYFNDSAYELAMKTGTGQVVSLGDKKNNKKVLFEYFRDNALFIGYAPFDDPKIVLVIILENAGWGGAATAPIARQLLDFYLLKE